MRELSRFPGAWLEHLAHRSAAPTTQPRFPHCHAINVSSNTIERRKALFQNPVGYLDAPSLPIIAFVPFRSVLVNGTFAPVFRGCFFAPRS